MTQRTRQSVEAIATDAAPAAIGPYAQATRAGGFVFCSGQIALDPVTMKMVEGGVEPEAEQVLKNLTAVITAAGASWSNVVRTTIYLRTMADFAAVNRIYEAHVGAARPARATVEVSGLPRGALVEIDALVYVGA